MSLLRNTSTRNCFGFGWSGNRKSRGLFVALLVLCVFASPAWAAYGGGSGTEGNPYLIETAEQMQAIGTDANDWDKHFKLTADIDLSGYTGTQFNIIGNTTTSFTGVFDGNFHIISNFTYTSAGANNIGIFGVAGGSSNMEIRDLGLDNPNVNAGTGDNVGALVGQLLSRGYVLRCSVAGGSVSGNNNVGGIMGYGNQYTTVYSSYSTANVSGTDCVGGLMGKSTDYGRIDECYSAGSVSGTTNTGGLLGLEDGVVYSSGTVVSSFWDTQASGQPNSPGGGTGKTTVEMQDPNTFMNAGWDFVDKPDGPSDIWAEPVGGGYPILWWQLSPWPALPFFSGGSGTIADPYQISTPAQLNSIGYNPRLMSAHFKLVNDIDLTGVSFWMMGDGWYPFTGTFDGNSNEILNFTYNTTLGTGNVGIFSYVNGPNAEIKDLGLRDPNVWAQSEESFTCNNIGSLVGRAISGTISNCYAEGGSVTGRVDVGGLVGDSESDMSIINCYATCSVLATNNTGGGLVGENSGSITDSYATGNLLDGRSYQGGLIGINTGTVSNCYATGIIDPDENTNQVGGLVGLNSGTISNSYATGSILNGQRSIGGLVGQNSGSGIISECYAAGSVSPIGPGGFNMGVGGLVGKNDGLISNSYAVGSVSGYSLVGGLVGSNTGTVSDSFWDKETSGLTTSAGGTGKTTAQMQTRSTFTSAGWDFLGESVNGTEDIWRLCVDLTDYPRFVWKISLLADFLCPDGVDALDLAFFLERWLVDDCNHLNGYCDGADLNRGGEVDGKDYARFAGNWSDELMAWALYEDFETGDFSKYDWQHSGDEDWVVVSDVNYEGGYSARSGAISDNEQSVLEVSVNTGIGSVSFYCKVSSEADEDYLRFYIDDELQDGWSGEQDWSLQEYVITSGPHTLKWLYMKDGSISSGSDCAWIDKITVMGGMP